MSYDRRSTLAGWATLTAGAAHLVAGAQHHHGALGMTPRTHGLVLTAVGVAQLVAGGRLLQAPSMLWRSISLALALCAGGGYLVEVAGGGHGMEAAGAVTLVMAALIAGAEASRRVRPRVVAIGTTSLALAVTGLGPAAIGANAADDNQPAGCSSPNRRMTLYAEELPPENGQVRLGWGLSPSTASIPGPLIEMVEGDCLAITVVNDVRKETLEGLRTDTSTPIGVSLHVHGVKYKRASDGTSHHDSWVPPGRSRTFIWYAQPRVVAAGKVTSAGTAGTWWYHDHVVGTSHGTGGIETGLVGGLVVRRAGDPRPDRSFTVVMGPKDELNYRSSDEFCAGGATSAPSDGCLKAVEGERVEFVVFNVGNSFHTFHLHGHNWSDNRTGIPDTGIDAQLIDVRGIGPSESFGFQVIAGESVGDGMWMLHCHVQTHSDHGMATVFDVRPHGATVTDPAGALPVHTH